MKPPATYTEWLDFLEVLKFEEMDEKTIGGMEQGDLEWTPGVAERFIQKVYDVMDLRLKNASSQFQLALNRSGSEETLMIGAILTLRKRLVFCLRLAKLPIFPDEVQEALSKVVKEFAESAQGSLIESAKTDRTGHLRLLIKNNPITGFEAERQVPLSFSKFGHTPQSTGQETAVKSSTKKRRVIWK
ncbi:hypothetical protein BBI11_13015 [Planococcus maritimus]|uniref:hypothetical protein n=1 Tax=Planococcus maritimus TaxID=192421 RepID=UPI00080F0339|nr:hypothetical protein [Planococcus maritimus]ANU17895.1 hypothetical protein BBI11_13015 [Planococcus maritimus]